MGRPHIARGLAADDDTRAWAHLISIKRMILAPGIKFSRGPRQRVKASLLQWNVDLKNRIFKTVFKQVSGSYLRFKVYRYMLFWHTFFVTLPL
jgi:hypothetical protein